MPPVESMSFEDLPPLEEGVFTELMKDDGEVGLFVGEGADLSPEQVIQTSYLPEIIPRVLDLADTKAVFWVGASLSSISTLLERDRGAIKNPRKCSAEEVESYLRAIPDQNRAFIREAAIKVLTAQSKALMITGLAKKPETG